MMRAMKIYFVLFSVSSCIFKFTVTTTASYLSSWFASYLDGRSQRVVIKDSVLYPTTLECGVQQGSVAGPIKFVMYSAPLQDIISSDGINSVIYADDTQLYIMFHPNDPNPAISRIEACVNDVKSWAVENKLAL